MSTIKVDEIFGDQPTDAVDLPNKLKVGGASVEQGYTASGSEPSSPSNGDYWWDSTNDKLYKYMDSEFKELGVAAGGIFYGDRGVFGSGNADPNGPSGNAASQIDYININTTGNGTDFGNMNQHQNSINFQCAISNGTTVVIAEQSTNAGSSNNWQFLSQITTATTGNATTFGDAYHYKYGNAGASNGTIGLFGGGYGRPGSNSGATAGNLDVLEYITIATAGNAVNWGGNLSSVRSVNVGISNANKALFAGGWVSGSSYYGDLVQSTQIDAFTWTTGSSATDFGDLLASTIEGASCQSDTRGIIAGGNPDYDFSNNVNVIQYVTIDTPGNAADFGDLSSTRSRFAGASNLTRGVFGGGITSQTNTMEYITIASTGNVTDFGDLQNTHSRAFGSSGSAS